MNIDDCEKNAVVEGKELERSNKSFQLLTVIQTETLLTPLYAADGKLFNFVFPSLIKM